MEQIASLEPPEPGCEFDSCREEKLRALFDHYDVDKNDMLDANELECMIVELGHEADNAMARALLTDFSDASHADGAGAITFPAFLRLVSKLEREAAASRDESAPAQTMISRFSLALVGIVAELARGTPEEGGAGSVRHHVHVRTTRTTDKNMTRTVLLRQ